MSRRPFIDELTDFIKFMSSLWGLLTGITIFFPLSNIFLKIIPLEGYIDDELYQGGLLLFNPLLVNILTILILIFLIFFTFTNREKIKLIKRIYIQKSSRIYFIGGLLFLFSYLSLYYVGRRYYSHIDPYGYFINDFGLSIFFIGFFSMVTYSFTLLGMLEYYDAEIETTTENKFTSKVEPSEVLSDNPYTSQITRVQRDICSIIDERSRLLTQYPVPDHRINILDGMLEKLRGELREIEEERNRYYQSSPP